MWHSATHRKNLFLVFSLLLLVSQLGLVSAQDNGCNSTAVVLSFADAVASSTTDIWLAAYANGNCSDALKAGALGLFESYGAMKEADRLTESTGAHDTLAEPVIGDSTVIRTNNVLGLEQEITVLQTLFTEDSGIQSAILNYSVSRDLSDYYIGLKISDDMWAVIPFGNFRTLTTDTSNQAEVLLGNGLTVTGEVISAVEDVSSGELIVLANTTEVTLLSLSKEPQVTDVSTGTWLLEMSDGESYAVTNPRFVYQYNGTRPNCLGACSIVRTTASTNFSVEVSGQTADLDIYTPDQVRLRPNGEVELALPNGNEVTGSLVSDGFRKHLAVDLIEQGYTLIINIEQTPVTLTK